MKIFFIDVSGTKPFGAALDVESVTFPRIYSEHSKHEISTTKNNVSIVVRCHEGINIRYV